MTTAIRLAVVGAGSRGTGYARLAREHGAVITAVADPDPVHRDALAEAHDVPADRRFADWQDLAGLGRVADAVVVATPDRQHVEPACAFAELGYDVLLEKPMAPTEAEATRIVETVERAGVLLMVCHVMRYSHYTRALLPLLPRVGDILSVEHLEPVGWWHQAHSYVRGNWGVEAASSPMLLAKSCHDIDWLAHVIDRPVRRVSSFGGLSHFTPDNRPDGATERCLDCPVQHDCAYAAPTIYGRFAARGEYDRWPLAVLSDEHTEAGLQRALREGPYGLCVYLGRNDVVDHQVVALEYEGGITASFTMIGTSVPDFRHTRIFGTRGQITGDGRTLTVHDFVTDTSETVDASPPGGASAADGHGGADGVLVQDFLEAVRTRNTELVLTSARASLYSHQVVWAAEKARRSGSVVTLT